MNVTYTNLSLNKDELQRTRTKPKPQCSMRITCKVLLHYNGKPRISSKNNNLPTFHEIGR